MLTSPEQNQRDHSQDSQSRVFRNPLLYSSIAVAVALLAVSWIMVSRWVETRRIEERTRQERAQKQQENDRLTIEQLGGTQLAIQAFYANPETLHRGQAAQLCYDVANAKTVKLEPESGAVWPSHYRCLDISPTKDTTYTLTIADAAGHTQTQSLTVKVQ